METILKQAILYVKTMEKEDITKEQFEKAFKKADSDRLRLIQSMAQICFNIEAITRMLSKNEGILPFYCKVESFKLFEVDPNEELPVKTQ